MSADRELIERIVHEVLNRLGTPAESMRSAGSEASPVELTEAVVTGEMLAERVNGTAVLHVGPKTVLTPSAHDFIRAKKLEIRRRTSERPATQSRLETTTCRVIAVAGTAALERALNDLSLSAETMSCPDAAAEAAAEAVQRDGVQTVLLFAAWQHRAAMLANRHGKVRAAAVIDAGRVAAIRKQMKPNVWCLDPRDSGYFELRNLIRNLATD